MLATKVHTFSTALTARDAKQTVKYCYNFGKKTDGHAELRALLGGKGANLAEMARIGLPVPPGFTISTEACNYFYNNDGQPPKSLKQEVAASIARIEQQVGQQFGAPHNPLLLSVRSGARESMPGMMDTILNLGLNDQTVAVLAAKSNNPAFAYDCYRRLIQMYASVVMGVQALNPNDHCPFESCLAELRRQTGVEHDNQLSAEQLKELIRRYQALILQRTGSAFPQAVRGAVVGCDPRGLSFMAQ